MKLSLRLGTLVAVAAAFGPAAAIGDTSASLDFDRVFNDRGGPAQSHYVATYRLAGAVHGVEVWRDRDLQVRRRTDDAIETIAVRPPGTVEWSMTVLDLKRRVRTDVDRTNLYRIGHFTDWFALTHSLTRPVGAYSLQALPRTGTRLPVALAPCRWYALVQQSRTSNICWSSAQRAPLVISSGDGVVQWQITVVDSRPLTPAVFAVVAPGFVHNDARKDIQGD